MKTQITDFELWWVKPKSITFGKITPQERQMLLFVDNTITFYKKVYIWRQTAQILSTNLPWFVLPVSNLAKQIKFGSQMTFNRPKIVCASNLQLLGWAIELFLLFPPKLLDTWNENATVKKVLTILYNTKFLFSKIFS